MTEPVASYVAVVGPGRSATELDLRDARRAGELLARAGVTVLTGGLGGVMGAAAAGATSVGGTAVGLLPGGDRAAGDPAHTVLLPLGLGELRNALLVRCADAVIAIGGSWGTLSELALARRTGVPVVTLRAWDVPGGGDLAAPDVDAAVARVSSWLRGGVAGGPGPGDDAELAWPEGRGAPG